MTSSSPGFPHFVSIGDISLPAIPSTETTDAFFPGAFDVKRLESIAYREGYRPDSVDQTRSIPGGSSEPIGIAGRRIHISPACVKVETEPADEEIDGCRCVKCGPGAYREIVVSSGSPRAYCCTNCAHRVEEKV